MIPIRSRGEKGQRGQALVELVIVLPIILAILVSTAELGLIFGRVNSLGYGSREGARTGSALAHGGNFDCPAANDLAEVDKAVIAAVQRILKSPDSGIDLARVMEIRIFKANETGTQEGSSVNVWKHAPGAGPKVDEVDLDGDGEADEVRLDFSPTSVGWWASCRWNGADPDSIGVTIDYKYEYVTPVPIIVNGLSGGSLELVLSETTVMALNPTVKS